MTADQPNDTVGHMADAALAPKPPAHVGEVIITVEGVHKYFGENHVLRGVDLEVRRREAVVQFATAMLRARFTCRPARHYRVRCVSA